MIPVRSDIHQEIKGTAVDRLLAPYRRRDLFIYRHLQTGAVVVAQRARGGTLMRELYILKHWPSVSNADREQLAFRLCPSPETSAVAQKMLTESHAQHLKEQKDNGYEIREFYRRRAHDRVAKHGNNQHIIKVPDLGE